jgi:hypothetical protein
MPRNIEFLGSTIDNSSSRFLLTYPVPDPDTAFLTPKAKKPFGASTDSIENQTPSSSPGW